MLDFSIYNFVEHMNVNCHPSAERALSFVTHYLWFWLMSCTTCVEFKFLKLNNTAAIYDLEMITGSKKRKYVYKKSNKLCFEN